MAAMFSLAVTAQDKKMTEIKTSQLPKGVSEWVTKNVDGGKITRAGKVEENGVLSYVAMVDMKGQNRAFLFDKDGKFTGKGDHLFKSQPATKPPVKTQTTKTSTTPSPAQEPAPKK